MVHVEEQRVPAGREPHQREADQGAVDQVEGLASVLRGEREQEPLGLLRCQPGQVHQRHRQLPGWRDHLERPTLAIAEGGAQRLVAPHDLAEDRGEQRRREPSLQPDRARHVVEGTAGLELLQEPEPLLGEGQGEPGLLRAGTRHRYERRRFPAGRADLPRPIRFSRGLWFAPFVTEGLFDSLGQGSHRGALEQTPHRQFDVERLPHPRHDLGGEQRVAAEVEEVIRDADPVAAQHLRPDSRHRRLDRVARSHVRTLRVRLRRHPGERPPVHLAVVRKG